MGYTEQPYLLAQTAIAQLKAAIYTVLKESPENGLTNVEIGRLLGIYMGHKGHQGHMPRILLAMMESEGAVAQNEETKRWRLRVSA